MTLKIKPIKTMKVVKLPKITLIGVEVKAHWKELHQKVPAAWEKLFTRKAELSNRTTDSYTEVYLGAEDDIYTQIVGAEVEPMQSVPVGLSSIQIPSQSYLHFHHTGPLTQIADSFRKMYDYTGKNGIETDKLKVDRGYLPGLPDSPHDLYMKVLN